MPNVSQADNTHAVKVARGLEGQVVLVTGGGAGIGRAAALALIREGAQVAVADVNRKAGERALSMVKSAGGDGIFIEADVSDAAEAKKMVRTTVNTYGRLDCAVNNAGIFRGINASTHKCTEKTWDEVMRVNLKGVWLCMKYELPQMLKQGNGCNRKYVVDCRLGRLGGDVRLRSQQARHRWTDQICRVGIRSAEHSSQCGLPRQRQ